MLLAGPAIAEEDREALEAEEQRRQQAFRDGMAVIVEDLNRGSFDKLVRAIDKDDMLERIFGLRLIDQKIKRSFREKMDEDDKFASFIASAYQAEAKDGTRATLLVVESRADRGRAVVRFDLPHFQVNYIEYDLALGKKDRLAVLDWTDYYWGHIYSDRIGLEMVQVQPNKNAVRKLIDYPSVRETQVFQVVEVLKAARDMDFDRYFEIVDGLDENLKRQRVVLKVGIDGTRRARKRRHQRRVLELIDEYFPEDPLYSIALLDYYFPDKQYENAYNALLRLQDKLGIDDSIMNARLSSATLVLGQFADSIAFAERSIEQEPGLELAWWAVLRARVAAEQYADAIVALDTLESTFGYTLDPEALGKDPTMGKFARSEEFRTWYANKTT